jgi:hypothetical protein
MKIVKAVIAIDFDEEEAELIGLTIEYFLNHTHTHTQKNLISYAYLLSKA